MITVDKATVLMIYLGFFLFLCLGTWVFSHIKTRKKKELTPFYKLTTCEYCAFNYLSATGQNISSCPQCNSYNKEA
jgi:hypothetical protein